MSQSNDGSELTTPNPNDASTDVTENLPKSNIPEPESVINQIPFTSPTGKKFTIIRTSELDPYEAAVELTPAEFAVLDEELAATAGDGYRGSARMAAKLSMSSASFEDFNDLEDLIASLPSIDEMVAHDPEITTGPDSGRVDEENRNVRIHTFLYAASREKDNDYHLIVGRASGATPPMYLTIEISGLPDTANPRYDESGLPDPSDPSYKPTVKKLEQARNAYKDYFGDELPGMGYDFYPALPVMIEGSLFFDMNHSSGGRPGPHQLRPDMPTIWEVHPITKIVFE